MQENGQYLSPVFYPWHTGVADKIPCHFWELLALTSPTSGGLSIGIVRSLTKATDVLVIKGFRYSLDF
jgi:hypothetical protein